VCSQIATKIEIYTGNLPPGESDPDKVVFKRLGHLSFDPNERSNHQARELKSVHVATVALILRFVIHRCHVNKLNIYNQVMHLTPEDIPEPAAAPRHP
jgi:centrosomal protein CEP104